MSIRREEIKPKSVAFYAALAIVVIAGCWLRLDQFGLQVVLDDEWHAVHQLRMHGPLQLFLTLGQADFSIPLGLLYWLESKLFGLSELGMRWPMLAAGLCTLAVFPLYVRKYLGDRVSLLFSALLAVSPLLLIYSRTARPYALTLLLSLSAVAALHRFAVGEKPSWKPGLAYVGCAVICVWLHIITLPMIAAPFIVLGLPAIRDRDWDKVLRLLRVGVPTLAILLALLLPPLLSHPEALETKLGIQLPGAATVYGAFFAWLGTRFPAVVFAGLVFAILGMGPLWRDLPLTRSVVLGLALTWMAILLTRPAWVQHSLTFARYMLPAIPLLLLAIACGFFRAIDRLSAGFHGNFKRYLQPGLAALFLLTMTYDSPLFRILANPNSNSLHSVYQFDFRDKENLIRIYQQDLPVSGFWRKLASFPPDTFKIAAAPFYFETYDWDAARWERTSKQRVMPAYLEGFCAEHRWGEVPDGHGFKFRNVGYVADKSGLVSRGFDFLVFQKPFTVTTVYGKRKIGFETADCVRKLRDAYPPPVYEDKWLLAIALTERAKKRFMTER